MFSTEFIILKSISISAIIFLISLIGFYFFWKLIDRHLSAWANKTKSDLDDRIVEGLRGPSKLLLVGLGLGLSLQLSPIAEPLQSPLMMSVKLFVISSLIWAVERLVTALIKSDSLPSSVSEASRSLFRTLSKVIIFSIGLLVILDTLGISITPLLASLGVGSVAIALAAQDTLSNLFSGFYLLLDRPFRIGDCIKIDSGVEGFVTKIGWRSTHIRLYANNVAVLPNTKIASSMITNFDFPESDTSVPISCGVSYGADLQLVEQIVMEVAFLIQNTTTMGSKVQAPGMVFTEFGAHAIHFNVVLKARRITEAPALKHEFIKALHARFQKENLLIPYPQIVVHNATSGSLG